MNEEFFSHILVQKVKPHKVTNLILTLDILSCISRFLFKSGKKVDKKN